MTTTRIKVLSVRLSKTGRVYDVIASHAKGECVVASIFPPSPNGCMNKWSYWCCLPDASKFFKPTQKITKDGFPRRADALDEIKRALNIKKEGTK
jgi:hypothetical protein